MTQWQTLWLAVRGWRYFWWAVGAALVLLLGFIGYCHRKDLPQQQAVLDAQAHSASATLKLDRQATDSILDSLPPPAKRIILAERAGCTELVSTCTKRIENLQKQLRPGWLKVFGEADYELPDRKPLLQGTLAARVGILLRVRPGTWAQGYISQPLTGVGARSYHVGIRQELRIF